MAEERIDIVAIDKIDPAIPQKLGQIADGAERAESYLKRLQAALSSINGSAIDRIAAAMARADAASAQLLNAQARLINAQTRANGASNAAANSAHNAAAATVAQGAAMNSAAGSANTMAGATNNAASANARYASTTTAASTASSKMAAGFGNTVNAANQHARAMRTANFANANIIAQMQDIGVSLAGGQNPLLVLIQQGSQLSYIASTLQGGWTQLIGIVGRMVLAFAPLLVVLGLVGLAFEGIKKSSEDLDPGAKKFISTLGLTHKEIERLKDVSVTWGDTFGGIMDTIAERLGTTTGDIKKFFSDAFQFVLDLVKNTAAELYGYMYAAVKTIIQDWKLLPAAIGGAMIGMANAVIDTIVKIINFGAEKINSVIHKVNENFGTSFGDLGTVAAEHFANPWAAQTDKVKNDFVANMKEGIGQVNKFFDDAAKAADKRRDARLKAQADKMIGDRTPKKPKEDHTAENRARAIAAVNLKLDDELARMHMLKDAREVQQRMDQIEESLASKKIKLSEDERASILKKVQAIQDFKRVQEEMDRIYSEITEPAKTYAAALQAITELQGKGVITAKQVAEQTNLAKDAFAQATDKLYDFKRAMEADLLASTLYGREAERNAYYQSLRNSEFGKANNLSLEYVKGVNAEVDALMRENDQLLRQQQLKSAVSSVVSPLIQQQDDVANKQAEYDAIAALERQGVLNHSNAMTARFQLDQKYSQQSLNNWGNFFGNLATLQSSGNKKLALIGKAAAVAQATIQGIQAVQNALATAAPWPLPLVFAAAAGVAAAANVAKIISTPVGNYATGGQFMVEGRSGVDANNINMNVTRGERVTVETPAQQRANDSPSAAQPSVIKAAIINQLDPRDVVAFLDSGDYDHVIVNAISRNQNQVTELVSRNAR